MYLIAASFCSIIIQVLPQEHYLKALELATHHLKSCSFREWNNSVYQKAF